MSIKFRERKCRKFNQLQLPKGHHIINLKCVFMFCKFLSSVTSFKRIFEFLEKFGNTAIWNIVSNTLFTENQYTSSILFSWPNCRFHVFENLFLNFSHTNFQICFTFCAHLGVAQNSHALTTKG